jgi:hypothetical protein
VLEYVPVYQCTWDLETMSWTTKIVGTNISDFWMQYCIDSSNRKIGYPLYTFWERVSRHTVKWKYNDITNNNLTFEYESDEDQRAHEISTGIEKRDCCGDLIDRLEIWYEKHLLPTKPKEILLTELKKLRSE